MADDSDLIYDTSENFTVDTVDVPHEPVLRR